MSVVISLLALGIASAALVGTLANMTALKRCEATLDKAATVIHLMVERQRAAETRRIAQRLGNPSPEDN